MKQTNYEILVTAYKRISVFGAASEEEACDIAVDAVCAGDMEIDEYGVDGGWDPNNQETDGTFEEALEDAQKDTQMTVVIVDEE